MLDRVRFVLVGTTHPGNIGATARAMRNMGLGDLALVRPAVAPDDPEAQARAAGGADVLARATVHADLASAVADCALVIGTSGRRRSLDWPELGPREFAQAAHALPAAARIAVVFGPERIGLDNEELARCTHLLFIPADPAYPSLNLAQAAQLVAWELRMAAAPAPGAPVARVPLASHAELEAYYARLEHALTANGFLDPDNPRHLMRRIRRMYGRAGLDQNEINILQGILTSLTEDPPRS
jgi:TrmH family RNA methyltransferase